MTFKSKICPFVGSLFDLSPAPFVLAENLKASGLGALVCREYESPGDDELLRHILDTAEADQKKSEITIKLPGRKVAVIAKRPKLNRHGPDAGTTEPAAGEDSPKGPDVHQKKKQKGGKDMVKKQISDLEFLGRVIWSELLRKEKEVPPEFKQEMDIMGAENSSLKIKLTKAEEEAQEQLNRQVQLEKHNGELQTLVKDMKRKLGVLCIFHWNELEKQEAEIKAQGAKIQDKEWKFKRTSPKSKPKWKKSESLRRGAVITMNG
ncbi:hypothetical protein R1sor_001229 [Riccia sorocarpa]|uniref:Uncharacterized protein n=1 Tax=Riccia sorocarpa TaxID=122646 RepID=A0ABD3GVC5_9MARC